MSQFSSAGRLMWPLLALAIAACARNPNPVGDPILAEGSSQMGACKPSQLLVVENRTGYAVSVNAGDTGPNPFRDASTHLWTVQSGVVDTVGSVPRGRTRVFFNVDRPPLPSGATMQVTGLHAWCV